MATAYLPERPHLDQLRKQARELQRSVRAGDAEAIAEVGVTAATADLPLTAAQLAIARRYGFASWPRLVHHVEAIRARFWEFHDSGDAGGSVSDRFLRLACLNYAADDEARPAQAMAILAANPGLPGTDIAVAAVCGDVDAVRDLLSRNGSAATTPTGPYRWSPLMYLAYGRLPSDVGDPVGAARALLDAGADPNDGRCFGGLPLPFTVLTGVFGGGEGSQPAHRRATELARLLLAHGADPNDGQTLYNRMFTTDDDFLEVLFDFGLGTGDGGPWRAALPDLLDPPATMLGGLLDWAVTHDQRDRVELLARRGVDVLAPLPGGATPIEVAVRNGHADLAARLVDLGAAMPELDPVETFIAVALAGDAMAVDATPTEVVAAARRARPALVVWAAGHGRVDAVELLVANGFDIDALGRPDVEIAQPWQTALHTAVERDDPAMVERLLELGADPSLRDARFEATPSDWVTHLGHDDLAGLFTR